MASSSEPTPELIHYPFDKLSEATKNFRDSGKIGEGGFGAVYRGVFKEKLVLKKILGGRAWPKQQCVAIKRLNVNNSQGQGMEQFDTEVRILSEVRHPNIVRLLGHCEHGDERLLVYEYIADGSLEKYLYGKKQHFLTWNARLRIAAGIGKALAYLHGGNNSKFYVFRDLKSANILLGEREPKLADFGITKLFFRGDEDQMDASTTNVQGTRGYLDPDYMKTRRPGTHTDVYCFGVILLELLTGLRPLDGNRPDAKRLLGYWARLTSEEMGLGLHLADSTLSGVPEADFVKAFSLALICVAEQPIDRPPMSSITEELEALVKPGEESEKLLKPVGGGKLKWFWNVVKRSG